MARDQSICAAPALMMVFPSLRGVGFSSTSSASAIGRETSSRRGSRLYGVTRTVPASSTVAVTSVAVRMKAFHDRCPVKSRMGSSDLRRCADHSALSGWGTSMTDCRRPRSTAVPSSTGSGPATNSADPLPIQTPTLVRSLDATYAPSGHRYTETRAGVTDTAWHGPHEKCR